MSASASPPNPTIRLIVARLCLESLRHRPTAPTAAAAMAESLALALHPRPRSRRKLVGKQGGEQLARQDVWFRWNSSQLSHEEPPETTESEPRF
eukprot:1547545-Pyramimonas_sp.AAC.1